MDYTYIYTNMFQVALVHIDMWIVMKIFLVNNFPNFWPCPIPKISLAFFISTSCVWFIKGQIWISTQNGYTNQVYRLVELFDKSVTDWLILFWPCIESWFAVLTLGHKDLGTYTAVLELIPCPRQNQPVTQVFFMS